MVFWCFVPKKAYFVVFLSVTREQVGILSLPSFYGNYWGVFAQRGVEIEAEYNTQIQS